MVYSLAKQTSIVVSYADGSEKAITGDAIDAETSLSIFDKTGDVVSIKVALEPGLE